MKNFKLWVHQKAFSENELLINPKEFPDVKIGDILEIYHPDEENSHLLLQVKSFKDELQPNSKEIISVEQGVASLFQLRAYKNVKVTKVQSGDVALDLVELVFKDQYISRSDMWRLKNSLVDSCIHMQQKLELSGIRAQVQELWSRWERVSCGAITNDTRVAFRSATAMVYLFIQMSSEMWDFDTCGDLYWEKAVGGFLTDLFNKWKDKGVNNEVTVVLFSRTFFKAKSLAQFPKWMRDNVKVDYVGRFYQDFYRAVVHHERRDEWHGLLQTLKAHFILYLKEVLCETQEGGSIPLGYNSSAAEGNFLETLNMTLNVFDKHYVDRNFERTGQLVVLLTPGAGVFDVDREMCKITRQRMIDNGIGSDLVCLAEQPLHAVPLFRFHNKTMDVGIHGGDYNIPHWLNYSFYTKEDAHGNSEKFKPRIKLAERVYTSQAGNPLPTLVKECPQTMSRHALLRHISSDHSLSKQDDIDYQCEEYDDAVFGFLSGKSPKPRTPATMRPSSGGQNRQRQTPSIGQLILDKEGSPQNKWTKADFKDPSRRGSSPGTRHGSYHSDDGDVAIAIPGRGNKANPLARIQREAKVVSHSFEGRRRESSESHAASISPKGVVVGSAGATTTTHINHTGQAQPKALVNPFGTSSLVVKLTSNRRRWTHTFPQGPSGGAIQTHHRNQINPSYYFSHYYPSNSYTRHRNSSTLGSSPSSPHYPWAGPVINGGGSRTPTDGNERPLLPHSSSENRLRPSASGSSLFSAGSSPSTDTVLQRPGSAGTRGLFDGPSSLDHAMQHHPSLRRLNLLWSYTGDQEWTPYTLTGVDWKSLTATACLPISTDFYPDRLSLEKDFLEFNYELLAEEDIIGPFMTVEAIFQELISQRLLQGFQLVVLPSLDLSSVIRSQRHPPLITNPDKKEYVLSIGRIFHKLCLHSERKTISVTIYKPRHPSLCEPIQYTYQLWSVQNEGYSPIQTTFRHEEIERYNWNYLDNYISSHDSEFSLVDSLKFWRSRFLLIPNTPVLVKRFADEHGISATEAASCEKDHAFRQYQTDAFLRFVEILNGIRRQTSTSRGPKASSGRQTPISGDLIHPGSRSSPGPDRQRHTSGTGSPAPHPPNTPAATTITDEPLSLCTPLQVIAKAMADQSKGLRFIAPGQKGIPPQLLHVRRGYDLGSKVVECNGQIMPRGCNMSENRLIQHASGFPHIPFIHGFYVYCLVLPENVPPMTDATKSHSWCDYIPQLPVNTDFPSHWFEVAVMEELSWKQKSTETSSSVVEDFHPVSPWAMREMSGGTPGFGSMPASSRAFKPPEIKNVMLEIDCNKTDRVEWCHVTYDGQYTVDRAFDLQVEWLVCTPSLLNEMLQGWSRKANTFGFHLVPAPTDPFHQHPEFANPLRCPLFIPLDIQSLKEDVHRRHAGGEEVLEADGIADGGCMLGLEPGNKAIDLFQELIMNKFGFILIRDKNQDTFDGFGFHASRRGRPMEYIHKSGVCFVSLINSPDDTPIVPSITPSGQGRSSPCEVVKAPRRRKSSGGIPIMVGRDSSFDIVDTLDDDEPDVTFVEERRKMRSGSIREVREKHMDGQFNNVGFLWSMNHTLTKRWRCSACGDEKVYDSIMKEVISISRNVDGKLTDFWLENTENLSF
ncbi:GATOR complex protein DEPDC5-like [Lytechinus variegatus]|uniref:GATOR complex protein DEPDC5-like n=1 Tax=Lytechinus variegatus TaxID=7654 RepID=UPI001BB110FC|nr:GATOR complex protein DEPDC5-like [Lytechinus variegatus]